jgi:hypothetical protein
MPQFETFHDLFLSSEEYLALEVDVKQVDDVGIWWQVDLVRPVQRLYGYIVRLQWEVACYLMRFLMRYSNEV